MAEKTGESLREAFGVLRDIKESLGRIDERTKKIDDETTKQHADHEGRIRTLELKDAKRSGIMAAIGTFAGIIGSGIVWFVKFLTGSN